MIFIKTCINKNTKIDTIEVGEIGDMKISFSDCIRIYLIRCLRDEHGIPEADAIDFFLNSKLNMELTNDLDSFKERSILETEEELWREYCIHKE